MTEQPTIVGVTGRATYWRLPDGTYNATPAGTTAPPSKTSGGYKYLSAIMLLKGDRP